MPAPVLDDEQHRALLERALGDAARHFALVREGGVVFGWQDRTIGVRTRDAEDRVVWLRVASELPTWAYGEHWVGNAAATGLSGIAKPDVLDVHEWDAEGRWFRAEVMSFVPHPAVSASPELREDPRLDERWWKQLHVSLEALAEQATDRVSFSQEAVTRRLRAYFGDSAEPTVEWWVTAHTDLHWNNLTRPECVLFDWEGWGTAPLGYDAATLYCYSLLRPETARTVHARFAEVLDTPDGRRSQLLVIARLLGRSIHGDHPDLVAPLHTLADHLTGRR